MKPLRGDNHPILNIPNETFLRITRYICKKRQFTKFPDVIVQGVKKTMAKGEQRSEKEEEEQEKEQKKENQSLRRRR